MSESLPIICRYTEHGPFVGYVWCPPAIHVDNTNWSRYLEKLHVFSNLILRQIGDKRDIIRIQNSHLEKNILSEIWRKALYLHPQDQERLSLDDYWDWERRIDDLCPVFVTQTSIDEFGTRIPNVEIQVFPIPEGFTPETLVYHLRQIERDRFAEIRARNSQSQ